MDAINIVKSFKRFRFRNKAQLAFIEDLYLLVNDGIPANRAIEMMAKLSVGIPREVASTIAQKISEGQMLAEGMKEWFAVDIVEIIRVGEEGGALAETLRSSINTMSQQAGVIGALVGAISYPLFVLGLACCLIIYLNNSVFDTFRGIKPEALWPPAGKRLVHIAHFIIAWWWLALLGIAVAIAALKRSFTHYVGELRPLLDRYPPFSIYKKLIAARLMQTLGLLVSNGVVFKSALRIMQYSAQPYILSHLVIMESNLGKGKGNVADVLNTSLIAPDDIMRLRIMAEVKGFEHGLIRMGVRGAEQSTHTLKLISKILGGILLVCAGYLIITIISGIYLTGQSMGAG